MALCEVKTIIFSFDCYKSRAATTVLPLDFHIYAVVFCTNSIQKRREKNDTSPKHVIDIRSL